MPIGATVGAKPERMFVRRYERTPFVVTGLWFHGTGTILHLHPVGKPWNVAVWQSPYHLMLAPGDYSFLRDGWISYFDRHLFDPRTAPVIFLGMLPRQEAPIVRLFRWLTGG